MANLPLHTGGLPQGELLGRYRTYEDAQKVVDHLTADQSFDVKALTIVGNELRSVEKVRGRLSYPRVAGTGALQGALFGTFMGLLLMLFSPQDPLMNLGMAVLMGMAIWMIIGVISFAARRGTRGFVSASQLVATSFDVVCDVQVAGKARQLVQGAGVSSLNAWNDPTGKSAALSGGQPQQAPQSQVPQDQGPQEQASGQGPAGESAPAEQQPAQQSGRGFQEGGRPRYGVRLADVEEPEQPAAGAQEAAGPSKDPADERP
ncbi:general stress protein [Nesterenkonia muleiensis]|uniref:general stress protein n=1 Tax=Nesterenkonia muleiensis TaxID=2282648 RepID=UPI000E722E4E|nr:general stress protein [Nesterenkonia muleiensis]